MRIKSVLLVGALGASVAGCEGFKEAMSAHQDVVARAGSQELSATRLGDLLGQSQFQVTKTSGAELLRAGARDHVLMGAHRLLEPVAGGERGAGGAEREYELDTQRKLPPEGWLQ